METNKQMDHIKYGISLKQKDFGDYYIETGEISSSALRAGYSKSYATSQAYQFLDNPKIAQYVKDKMDEHAEKGVADQDEILNTLTNILRGKSKGTGMIGIGPGKQAVTDVPPSISEKLRASELLGRRYMMWTDKQVLEEHKPTIIDDVPDED